MEDTSEKPDLIKMGILKVGQPSGATVDTPKKAARAALGGVTFLVGIVVIVCIFIFYFALGIFYFGGYSDTPFIPFVIFGIIILMLIFKKKSM
jgi:hypothetical protein